MPTHLLHASRAVERIDDALPKSILERSRANNPDHGTTVVLCVHHGCSVFLRAREGARGAVNTLYGKTMRGACASAAIASHGNGASFRLR